MTRVVLCDVGPRDGLQNEADILALIEPLLREGSAVPDADALAMASFLHGMALDRRRLKESAAVAPALLFLLPVGLISWFVFLRPLHRKRYRAAIKTLPRWELRAD